MNDLAASPSDTQLLAGFSRLDSSAVSDALDALGLPSGQGGFDPVWDAPPIAGFAVTVELEPHVPEAAGPHLGTTAVADAQDTDVLVVANGGRTDVSGWGGLLSLGASRRGVRGVIVDGACRDVDEARDLRFPVYARGRIPATARGRLRQRSTGEPVRMGNVIVAPGDVVLADATGVVAVPRAHAVDVLERAQSVAVREDAIAAELRAGAPLQDAMRDARLAGTETSTVSDVPGTPAATTPAAAPTTAAATGTSAPVSTADDPSPEVIDQLRGLPTAAISDALDAAGIDGQLHGIAGLTFDFAATGPAFTVRYEDAGAGERGSVGDFLDEVPAGSLIVIANNGHTDATVWGGIMTETARAQGIAGTVIDGVCRDVGSSLTHGYPLFTRGSYMRTGKDRVQLTEVGGPLTIGEVHIRPGDIVCADADGVLVVPAEHAAEVAAAAQRIEDAEAGIVGLVRDGSSLVDARARTGYHDLQARRN